MSRGATGLVTGVTTKKDSGSTSVTLASSVAFQPFGPLTSLTYGNGLVLTKTYSEDYLISTLQVQDPSTSAYILNRFYAFGDNINLTTITDDRTAPAPPSGSVTDSYSYPTGNNLLSTLTESSTTVRSFSYDGAGNVTADTRGSTTYNYSYNKRNRLAELAIGSTVTADYTYDGLERMAIRTTSNMTPAGTTHYLYDLTGHLLVEADDTGQTLREYVWLDDMPLAVVADVDTMSPNLYYVHADHLNTPVRMTDTSKSVVWDAFFLPFGAVASITGSASNNQRFPGQYFLIEDGLHYNWYRHYDPTLGRYVQPDPLALVYGPSLYAYARSAPTMDIDPDGRYWWWGALGGAFVNLSLQMYQNLSQNGGDWTQAAMCVNWTNVGVSAVAGFVGPTILGNVVRSAWSWVFGSGNFTNFAASTILYGMVTLPIKSDLENWIPPYRLGSGCDCVSSAHPY